MLFATISLLAGMVLGQRLTVSILPIRFADARDRYLCRRSAQRRVLAHRVDHGYRDHESAVRLLPQPSDPASHRGEAVGRNFARRFASAKTHRPVIRTSYLDILAAILVRAVCSMQGSNAFPAAGLQRVESQTDPHLPSSRVAPDFFLGGFGHARLVAGVAAGALAITAATLRQGETEFLVSIIRSAAVIAIIPALWIFIQVLPLPPLAHPIWASTQAALEHRVLGTISIDPAASIIALGQYLISFRRARFGRRRRRPESSRTTASQSYCRRSNHRSLRAAARTFVCVPGAVSPH